MWSFYCETLSFAANYEDAILPIDFFRYMQEICRKFFPGWKESGLLEMLSDTDKKVLSSLELVFKDQMELEKFLLSIR